MKDIKPAIMMLFVFTIICGGMYPAAVSNYSRNQGSQLSRGINRTILNYCFGYGFALWLFAIALYNLCDLIFGVIVHDGFCGQFLVRIEAHLERPFAVEAEASMWVGDLI